MTQKEALQIALQKIEAWNDSRLLSDDPDMVRIAQAHSVITKMIRSMVAKTDKLHTSYQGRLVTK